MPLFQTLVLISFLGLSSAFSPTTLSNCLQRQYPIPSQIQVLSTGKPDAGAVESEVEALLRKAKELRAEAQEDEEHLHSKLIQKKTLHDQELDDAINQLFPLDDEHNSDVIVQNLRKCQFSTDKMKDVVTRIHEREVAARGLQHVESKTQSDTGNVKFEVVSSPDELELQKMTGLVDRLTAAAEVLDEEYWKEKRIQGEDLKLHHTDVVHWTKGDLAKILKQKAGNLGREHTDQFKKRSSDYYDAARRKKSDSDK